MIIGLSDWAAANAHANTKEAWSVWLKTGAFDPDIALSPNPVPAMMRRRLTALGRIALNALGALDPQENESIIFASNWGDISRSYELVDSMVKGEGVSPAGFSGSIHNGIGAVASIWKKNHAAYRAITAGGRFTTIAALTEAAALLANGETSVIVMRYEENLPSAWHATLTDQSQDVPLMEPMAYALRLVAQPAAVVNLRVESVQSEITRALSLYDELRLILSGQCVTISDGLRGYRLTGASDA